MTRPDRKALIAAYKEQKTVAGVFAVICNATGQVWVGTTPHIDTRQNGLWFALRMGGSPHITLQSAWREQRRGRVFGSNSSTACATTCRPWREGTELKARSALWIARLEGEPL